MTYSTATPRIASYVLVRKNNKIAFVLRSNTSWMNGHYGLPSGKVEKDEPYSEAAIREAKEEIGIDIKPTDLKFLHIMHRLEGEDWVDIFFEAIKWQGEPYNAEPELHEKIDWFYLNKTPSNTIPSVKYALKHIAEGSVFSEYGWS